MLDGPNELIAFPKEFVIDLTNPVIICYDLGWAINRNNQVNQICSWLETNNFKGERSYRPFDVKLNDPGLRCYLRLEANFMKNKITVWSRFLFEGHYSSARVIQVLFDQSYKDYALLMKLEL